MSGHSVPWPCCLPSFQSPVYLLPVGSSNDPNPVHGCAREMGRGALSGCGGALSGGPGSDGARRTEDIELHNVHLAVSDGLNPKPQTLNPKPHTVHLAVSNGTHILGPVAEGVHLHTDTHTPARRDTREVRRAASTFLPASVCTMPSRVGRNASKHARTHARSLALTLARTHLARSLRLALGQLERLHSGWCSDVFVAASSMPSLRARSSLSSLCPQFVRRS
jgi:hypothetical protein